MKIILTFKLHLAIILSLVLLTGCTNSKKFSISGNIIGAEGKILKFYRLNLNGEELQDSTKLSSSGSFTFTGDKLLEPTFFTLHVENKNIALLNDSNINIKISGTYDTFDTNCLISNSKESSDIQMLNNQLRKTISAIDDVKLRFSKANTDTERNQLINEVNTLVIEQKKFISDYVIKNPRSFTSYYAVFQKYNAETFILNVYDKKDQGIFATIATSLNIYYHNNERVKNLVEYVLNAKKEVVKAKTTEYIKNLPSISYPDLNIPNKDGRKIALSSFKGKVILLTFWATWNKESLAFNQELKRVNKKFGNRGFEIYQVSLDQNKLYWESALRQNALTWTNVCEFTFPNAYSATIYNISNLPANFLISKSGEIIGRNLEGAMLDEKIAKNL